MAQQVRELMTRDPVVLSADTPVGEAARRMRDHDIGNVLVVEGDRLVGIVTDRDLVVRGLADRDNLSGCPLREVCSATLTTAAPDEDAETAIARMRERAVRRIPVVEGDRPVGVLSLGDAAVDKDSRSVLAGISAARANT